MVATPEPPASTTRLFTQAFVVLGIAELAYFVAQGLLIAITPRFAAGPLGADEAGPTPDARRTDADGVPCSSAGRC
ncbi:MAG: hypothetical protein LC744_08320 [Chloroflexi bacterium]|nr:hypothetical protein [Chloroflexota bacterium]